MSINRCCIFHYDKKNRDPVSRKWDFENLCSIILQLLKYNTKFKLSPSIFSLEFIQRKHHQKENKDRKCKDGLWTGFDGLYTTTKNSRWCDMVTDRTHASTCVNGIFGLGLAHECQFNTASVWQRNFQPCPKWSARIISKCCSFMAMEFWALLSEEVQECLSAYWISMEHRWKGIVKCQDNHTFRDQKYSKERK